MFSTKEFHFQFNLNPRCLFEEIYHEIIELCLKPKIQPIQFSQRLRQNFIGLFLIF